MNYKSKKLILITCIFITGLSFAIMFYLYNANKQNLITELNYSPYAFQNLSINESSLNHSISIRPQNRNLGFNLDNTNFKLYYYKKHNLYNISYKFNNLSKPLITLYEQPKYKYGLFNDKKSFWIVLSDTINRNRYNVFVFYSLYKPKPIKVYESETDENFNNINIKYSNDVIKIIAPSGITEVSKFGIVNSKSLK